MFSNYDTFVKKIDIFSKAWGAPSIGDAATIRNFTVIVDSKDEKTNTPEVTQWTTSHAPYVME